MTQPIRMCLDKFVPPELEEEAKRLAVAQNPANAPRQATPFELAADWRFLWMPGSTLRVRFLAGDPHVQARVEHYAHEWEAFANIKFEFASTGEAPIRIAFAMDDGSWSYLGTQALSFPDQDTPTMNYGWLTPETDDDEYARVVLHEFGHALGCIHEHQHPFNGIPWDREKAYEYYRRQQGWSRADVDIQVFQRYDLDQLRFSEFDRDSIMLYPVPEEITVGNFSVGWNRRLSALDKQYIGTLYPFA